MSNQWLRTPRGMSHAWVEKWNGYYRRSLCGLTTRDSILKRSDHTKHCKKCTNLNRRR